MREADGDADSSTVSFVREEARQHLELLAACHPSLTLWWGKTKLSSHIEIEEPDDVEIVLKGIADQTALGRAAFITVNPMRPDLEEDDRGGAVDVVALRALVLDIDVDVPGHHKPSTKVAASFEDARRLLDAIALVPTLVVDTGGGLHAWYVLDRPVADRAEAAVLLRRWRATVERHSAATGVPVDTASYDLVRVLRVAGTVNAKTSPPKPIRTLSAAGPVALAVLDGVLEPDPGVPERRAPAAPTTGPERALLNGGDRRPEVSAFHDFDRQHTAQEVLAGQGWTFVRTDGLGELWRWPDASHEHSARVYSDTGTVLFFTTSFEDIGLTAGEAGEKRRSFRPYQLACAFTHGALDDDTVRRFAKELRQKGYGTEYERSQQAGVPGIKSKEKKTMPPPAPPSTPTDGSPSVDAPKGWGPLVTITHEPDDGHDDDGADEEPERPVFEESWYHGPLGRYTLDAAPYTEADPLGAYVTSLVAFVTACSNWAYFKAGNVKHPPALFATLVGRTAGTRKGTADAVGRLLLEHMPTRHEPAPYEMKSGIGSGEALLRLLDPAAFLPDDQKSLIDKGDEPPGAVLVVESEFAKVLKVSGREHSTLGQYLRDAWDQKMLATHTVSGGGVEVTDYHLSILGHITEEELLATTSATDVYGGFMNRFMWFGVHRTQLLPGGGNVPDDVIARHAPAIRKAVLLARLRRRLVGRTPAAEELWKSVYVELETDDPPGLLGFITSRGSVQVMRMALGLALADLGDTTEADPAVVIDVAHVEAALRLWQQSRATAARLWPATAAGATGLQRRVLDTITAAGDKGLTRWQLTNAFSRHFSKAQLDAAVVDLERAGLIDKPERVEGRGRPTTLLKAKRGQ